MPAGEVAINGQKIQLLVAPTPAKDGTQRDAPKSPTAQERRPAPADEASALDAFTGKMQDIFQSEDGQARDQQQEGPAMQKEDLERQLKERVAEQIAQLKHAIEKPQPPQPQIKLDMAGDDAEKIKPANISASYFVTDSSFAMNQSIAQDDSLEEAREGVQIVFPMPAFEQIGFQRVLDENGDVVDLPPEVVKLPEGEVPEV